MAKVSTGQELSKQETARTKQRLPLAQRPVPTEHLQGFTATQKPCPGSRPLLGTEQCHGGDNGLCLAGCENIRCAGSTAAESSLNEKRYRRQPLGTLCLPHWCRGAGKARSKTSNC
ncbi:uncharacterized protein LOC143273316 isoform X5 [Peromyscus maniculatus bairdii]